ncbi:hypothetical protein F5148DRAFT_287334 [Russula earlei]|uniref:Uncharacterized protein n=1 Tax=Russula earlei TaxID=71964 RepID=A0ACC0UNN7_9AGAM|nr:hypothetical protein F5148DRAFT_287334 [Russula earlei]
MQYYLSLPSLHSSSSVNRDATRYVMLLFSSFTDSRHAMDAPTSTPFPLLTFQNSDSTDSPAALRDFLLQAITDNQPSLPYRIKHPHLETWIPILSGLSDYVLSSFPSISTGTWDILHEKAVLVNATVEVFHLFLQRFSDLFDTAPHVARKALVRLLILCHILDCRNDGDVSAKDGDDGIPSPQHLREKCLTVAIEVMRYLGDSLGSAGVELPTWEAFRSVCVGCLGIGEAVVLENTTLEFPLELSPFQQPYVREVTSIPDKSNIQDLPSFFVRGPVEAVNLLCLFFDVLTRSMLPPVSSQPFHTDLVLRLTKLMQSVFDLCLPGTWPLTSQSMMPYLVRICCAERRLLGLKNAHIQRVVFSDMVSRLLLHRLGNTCTHTEDAMLRDLLNEIPEPHEYLESGRSLAILSALAQLPAEDETGFNLAMAYISRRNSSL